MAGRRIKYHPESEPSPESVEGKRIAMVEKVRKTWAKKMQKAPYTGVKGSRTSPWAGTKSAKD